MREIPELLALDVGSHNRPDWLRQPQEHSKLDSFPATQALIERVIREREAEVVVLDKKSPEIVR